MSAPTPPRRPRVFAADDPTLEIDAATAAGTVSASPSAEHEDDAATSRPVAGDMRRGFSWGGLLLSALTGLAMIGIGAWFARLVSAALARDDIVGWAAYGLLVVAAVAAAVLVVKELIGFSRLTRLARLKRDVKSAIEAGDAKAERHAVRRLKALYHGRAELRWGLQRFAEHERDVHDAGALMALAERELVAPLDGEARRAILKSARRVSIATAMSPVFFFAVLYVLVENVRMLRGLATLYGGRPGVLGGLKLARMVVTHIIATGGIAMTDDLLGQFLGQDLIRRLSRRLGEGLFNGALTARIGAAAIEVCRPLPFIEATPVRVRDLVADVARSLRQAESEDARRDRKSSRISG